VTVGYRTQSALEKVKVCRLQKRIDYGVGILTPNLNGPVSEQDRVNLVVTVKLPSAKYRTLETDLLQFDQFFWARRAPIHFDTVSLKGVNAPISVPALFTKRVTIENANGDIDGWFNATDSLNLKTVNAKIQVIAFLGQSREADVTNISMANANGPISSDIILYIPGPPHLNFSGKYNVVAENANAPSQIRFRSAPVNSVLNVNVTSETTLAQSYVKLHDTFEGSFMLRSMPYISPVVDQPVDKVEDPAGWGRERRVEFSEEGAGVVKGSIAWIGQDGKKDEKREVGSVAITMPFGGTRLIL